MDYGVVLIMAGQSNHSNSGRRLMQPAEVWVSLWQSRGASKGEHSPAGLQAACGIRSSHELMERHVHALQMIYAAKPRAIWGRTPL